MNALVNINTALTMSSREIAELVESRHDSVKRTIDRLSSGVICLPPLVEYLDPLGRPAHEYVFSGEQGKRDSIIVVAQLCPEFTARLVDRWQELESKQKPSVPQSYAEALLEAGRLALENEKKAEQLRIAAPKVQFVDNFTQRESLQNASQVGQTLGMSAIRLNRALDEVGGVYNQSVKRGRVFCQAWIDGGYGKMIQNEIGYPQAMFTTTGVYRVTEILTSEGVTS